MKKEWQAVLGILVILVFTGCPGAGSDLPSGDNGGGTEELTAGDSELHSANSVGFTMRYVPSGGPFIMGEHVEATIQNVTLTKSYWMGETEVTQGLWEDVMGTTWPGTDPNGSGYGAGDDYPAYYVNWYDAAAFCNALTLADGTVADDENVYYSDAGLTTAYISGTTIYADWSKKGYRLPTEAEWEYAARYIDGISWNHGNHVSGDTSGAVYDAASCSHSLSTVIGDYAWYSGNNSGSPGDSTYGTKEVAHSSKTANALGIYDMSGNMYEWCWDWRGPYSGGSELDPPGSVSGSDRALRSGDWLYSVDSLRCAFRGGSNPSGRYGTLGLRIVRIQ